MQARSRVRESTVARMASSEEAIRARDERTIARALRILERRACDLGPLLGDPTTCGAFFRLRLGNETREHFEVAFLDTRHRLIAVERLFSGSVDGAEVRPRIVVQRALVLNAAAVVVAHYVARHIMRVMCPVFLCALEADRSLFPAFRNRVRAHNGRPGAA